MNKVTAFQKLKQKIKKIKQNKDDQSDFEPDPESLHSMTKISSHMKEQIQGMLRKTIQVGPT